MRDARAKKIRALDDGNRLWRYFQTTVKDALTIIISGQKAQGATRGGDRGIIAIGRDVTNIVDHARSISRPCRVAFGPCRK